MYGRTQTDVGLTGAGSRIALLARIRLRDIEAILRIKLMTRPLELRGWERLDADVAIT